jgi:hypothetical protein
LGGSIPRHLSPFTAGKLAGMKKEELEQCERDWIAAEAELDAARKLLRVTPSALKRSEGPDDCDTKQMREDVLSCTKSKKRRQGREVEGREPLCPLRLTDMETSSRDVCFTPLADVAER